MAKEAYYFSHDSNARSDPKIMQMRSVYKGEGYGWYWILLEKMRAEEDYKLSMQGKYVWNAFALDFDTTAEKAEAFVRDCISEFNLFTCDEHKFWSDSFLRRMKMKDEKSEKARQSANARWNKPSENQGSEQTQSDGNANASRNDAIKESKLNKSKDINNSAKAQKFIPPTIEQVETYCKERNNGVDANKWYDFYTSKGWMIGKNKMKDWKSAVRTWENNSKTVSTLQEQRPNAGAYKEYKYWEEGN